MHATRPEQGSFKFENFQDVQVEYVTENIIMCIFRHDLQFQNDHNKGIMEDSRVDVEGLPLQVLRSSQTDAGQLDEELLGLLKDTLNKCLGTFHSNFMRVYYKEMLVLLRSVMFCLTVGLGKPTPGMALLNVTYRNEYASSKFRNDGPELSRLQRTLLYVGDIVVPYMWSRVASSLARALDRREDPGQSLQRASSEKMWKVARRIESVWMTLELMNAVVYLRQGTYRRLLERLVGARVVYSNVGASRHISFDYLNRQLIWSEISDFILFLLPLVNVGAVRNFLYTYLPMNRALGGMQLEASCGICGSLKDSPIRCQVLPCKHIFCYYCIAGRMDINKHCCVCSEDISSMAMI